MGVPTLSHLLAGAEPVCGGMADPAQDAQIVHVLMAQSLVGQVVDMLLNSLVATDKTSATSVQLALFESGLGFGPAIAVQVILVIAHATVFVNSPCRQTALKRRNSPRIGEAPP